MAVQNASAPWVSVSSAQALLNPVEYLATGVRILDLRLEGGLPRGRIVELVGPSSSGKTSLLFSVLKQATHRGEMVAYVDTFDTLDPGFAAQSGIDLQRLLWIRCGGTQAHPMPKALRATDILVQAGGFGVVVLDLDSGEKRKHPACRKVPLHTRFRRQRALQESSTVLGVLEPVSSAGSAAALVLTLRGRKRNWTLPQGDTSPAFRDADPPHSLLQGLQCEVSLLRGGKHGNVTFYSHL